MHFDTTFGRSKREVDLLKFMQSDQEGIQSAFTDIKGQCGELENLFIDWKLSVTEHWHRMTIRQIIGLSEQYKNSLNFLQILKLILRLNNKNCKSCLSY